MKDSSERFVDRSLWEEAESKGEEFLKNLIDDSLKGTSVTAILTGSHTSERKWVKYEIFKSLCSGKGLFSIHINRIKSKNDGVIAKGKNPLDRLALKVSEDFKKVSFYHLVERKWSVFPLLSGVNNRIANSIHFPLYENALNAFFGLTSSKAGKLIILSSLFPQEYDWMTDNGYRNIGAWVEEAYQTARKHT